MSIAEKLAQIAANEKRVYDAGYEKGKAEGSAESMRGTYVIRENPSIVNEEGFFASVVGRYHYYNGTEFVEGDLTTVRLWYSNEYGDGGVELNEKNQTMFWLNGGWMSPSGTSHSSDNVCMRTLILTEEPTDAHLCAWLTENADYTPLPSTDYEDGYADGRKAEYDAFWDTAQYNGGRTEYSFAFSGNMWSQESFKPKYPIKPTRCTNMLAYWGYNMSTAILKDKLIDLRFLSIDLSDCTDFSGLFYANRMVKQIGTIDVSMLGAVSLKNLFASCGQLVSIDNLSVTGQTSFTNTFDQCSNLEKLTIIGNIGRDIDLQWSVKLSIGSIESVLLNAWGGAVDGDGVPTVTLSKVAVNKAFETSEDAYDGIASGRFDEFLNQNRLDNFMINLI